ncbi:DUF881 domain-containing protein [Streptomyces sp. PR69]|uniref:DUF881 domain-containing protein n=1 Tax=Streptomyces sp. PR69 TaxID=2984950 RepID=UPI003A5BCDCE
MNREHRENHENRGGDRDRPLDATPGSPGNPENSGNPENAGTPGAAEQPAPFDLSKAHPATAGGTGTGPEKPSEAPAPAPDRAPAPEPPSDQEEPQRTGRQRLREGLWPPRVTRAQLIVAVLLFVLGLGLAIQVRSTSDSSALRGARQEDLVRILDEIDNRSERLEEEKQRLEDQRAELENSSDQAEEARRQTRQKEQQLAILAGTVAAQGPGITLTIDDTLGAVEPDALLDAIQELRAAGAEAIQIDDVRVAADTYLSGRGGAIEVDGKPVTAPYRFKVIGKPQDLEPALNIPGGVVQTLEKEQATATVTRSEKIVVNALRPEKRPDYARSSSR